MGMLSQNANFTGPLIPVNQWDKRRPKKKQSNIRVKLQKNRTRFHPLLSLPPALVIVTDEVAML